MLKRLAVTILLLGGLCFATPLPFIHDHYSRALAEARHRNLPLFVECWAPW